MAALDQYEALGCLGSNNLNYRMGSGAYGYSKELKKRDHDKYEVLRYVGASASQFLHFRISRNA